MVNDLLKIFRNAENIEKAILDNYVPKDGTYFRIDKNNMIKRLTIKRNNVQQNELYQWFKEADYNSNIIDINKPVDIDKRIHSNNYYTVFMKCDILPEVGTNQKKVLSKKQLEETIERYFDTFLVEIKDKKVKKIMETMKIKEVDKKELEVCKNKIKNAIPKIINEIKENNLSDNKYVKIFIKKDIKDYQREGNRYLYQKIFNKNDYNIELNGQIWGVSNDNMGMNSKKPYLELKTTKFKVPYRISLKDAIISKKFFEWINNLGSNIYIPLNFDFTNIEVSEKNIEKDTCLYLYKTINKQR